MAKKTVTKSYTVWITLMLPSSADAITALCIRKGYGVNAADTNKKLLDGDEDSMSHVLAIDLKFDVPEEKAETPSAAKGWAFDRIKEVLNESSIKYYSVIMNGDGAGSHWKSGNIKVPEKLQPITQGPYR